MGHIRGHSRHQVTLFPEALDDLIPRNHPVQVVEKFVNGLDLAELGSARWCRRPRGARLITRRRC